jgi:membrane glycosyltransferase
MLVCFLLDGFFWMIFRTELSFGVVSFLELSFWMIFLLLDDFSSFE